MKVAVLGCGPSGLLAVHAAKLCGHEVTCFSRKQRSEIHGAQYIHEPIPELCESEPTKVSYAKVGNSTGYALKVYGSPTAPTSWTEFPTGEVPAWPMGGVYSVLWRMYSDEVSDVSPVTGAQLDELLDSDSFDIMFNSVPRNALCDRTTGEGAHSFQHAEVVFSPDCALEGMDNVVLYSGRAEEDWYRTSRLFGHAWTEYPARRYIGQLIPDSWMVGIKPTYNDCDCHDHQKHVRIGRFGKWQKRTLVTDAFNEAMSCLDTELIG